MKTIATILALALPGCQSASVRLDTAGASLTIAAARPNAPAQPTALPPPQSLAK